MIPLLSQIPQQYSTVILLALIILAFIIAYKVMKMVFQTLLITVLSGGFYLALVYLFNFGLSLNHVLFYSFLGASLYMGFKFLASAYQIAEKLISLPYKILRSAITFFRRAIGALKDKADSGKIKRLKDRNTKQSNKSSENKTKEVVLDKVINKDKDEEH